MPDNEGSGQSQQYCTSCGAQVRPGHSFCVSCGAVLNADKISESSAGLKSDDPADVSRQSSEKQGGSPQPTRVAAGSSTDGFDVQEIASKLVGWFKNLPTAVKVLLAGLILLGLLVVLSPLAFIVAALLFGVSVIVLIVRVAQRGAIGGWAIATGSSLVLVLVFGGISGALYGFGFWSSVESDTAASTPTGATSTSLAEQGSDTQLPDEPETNDLNIQSNTYPIGSLGSDYPLPEYEVIDFSDTYGEGVSTYVISISTGSLNEENLRAIAEDAAVVLGNYDQGIVSVYNEDLQPYDPVPNAPGPLESALDGTTLLSDAAISVQNYQGQYTITRPPFERQ